MHQTKQEFPQKRKHIILQESVAHANKLQVHMK